MQADLAPHNLFGLLTVELHLRRLVRVGILDMRQDVNPELLRIKQQPQAEIGVRVIAEMPADIIAKFRRPQVSGIVGKAVRDPTSPARLISEFLAQLRLDVGRALVEQG